MKNRMCILNAANMQYGFKMTQDLYIYRLISIHVENNVSNLRSLVRYNLFGNQEAKLCYQYVTSAYKKQTINAIANMSSNQMFGTLA